MSTAFFGLICGALVFSPFLFEAVRWPVKGALAAFRKHRRAAAVWPIESESELERSVAEMLYGRDHRSPDVEAEPIHSDPVPGPPLRRVEPAQAAAVPAPPAEEEGTPAERDVRAA